MHRIIIEPNALVSKALRSSGKHKQLWEPAGEVEIGTGEAAAVMATIDQLRASPRIPAPEKRALGRLSQVLTSRLDVLAASKHRPLSDLYETKPDSQNPLVGNFLSGDRWGHYQGEHVLNPNNIGPRLPSALAQWKFCRRQFHLLERDERLSAYQRAHRLGQFHGACFYMPLSRGESEWASILRSIRIGEDAKIESISERCESLCALQDTIDRDGDEVMSPLAQISGPPASR